MGRISRLPPDLVNQIAAGEVVERPASVVKELVENALDAGARRIEVHLEGGGKRLVRIVDDGEGIAPEDLPLAVASHATSKLPGGLDDLFEIRTLGFRGEALASVGSVADLRLVSRARGAPLGAEVRVRAGEVDPVRPAAAAGGTVVEVRDLFAAVPARRKFLRDDGVELKHCIETATRLALASPGVAFRVDHEGRRAFEARAVEDPIARVGDLFGRDLARDLIPVEAARGRARVRGLASLPHRTRADSALQHVLLNSRPVRDRLIAGAIRDAYDGFLMVRRAPVVFLWLDVAPDLVDVNVHPAKLEVRFREPREVFQAARHAIRSALEASCPVPALALTGTPTPARTAPLPFGDRAPFPLPAPSPSPFLSSLAPSPSPAPADRCFQLRSGYLIEETADGFRLIDPHALHERILYEELKARVLAGALEVQSLLVPALVDLEPAAEAALEAAREPLAALGLVVEPFGPGVAAVQAVPALIPARCDLAALVLDLIAAVAAERRPPAREAVFDSLLATMACKAAVKLGDPLKPGEMEALLARRALAERSHLCPHGRPTTLSFTQAELERQFRR